jgi:hypothetical protein
MPERNGDPIVDTVIEHRKDLMKRYPEGTLDLSADNMADALEQARKKARLIANIAAEAKLIVQIQGKDYPKVECWTTLARGYGLTPEIIGEPELIAHPTMAQDRDGNDIWGWRIKAGLRDLNTDQLSSPAYGECYSNEFVAKSGTHAVLSMAQTRAISKSCRNALSWVMVLAGVEATPAEEMTEFEKRNVKEDGGFKQMFKENGVAKELANRQASELSQKLSEARAAPHIDNILKKHKAALDHIKRFAPDRYDELKDIAAVRRAEFAEEP